MASGSLGWDVPACVRLGEGFGTVQVINTDQGFTTSNTQGQLLYGAASAGIPTITSVNGTNLSAPDPSVPVAHADTVVPQNTTVTLTGTGFGTSGSCTGFTGGPCVNLFTATGNVGPLTPLGGGTSTQLQVVVPSNAPTGPASFVVVNGPYTGNVNSNAVSAVIGAQVTITSVTPSGNTVTVNGAGFSTLSVINLFNVQGVSVVNLGGLNPDSSAKVPLTFVDSTQVTFTRPAGAVAGPAFVEVLNPPFIPFASSGNNPNGALTFP